MFSRALKSRRADPSEKTRSGLQRPTRHGTGASSQQPPTPSSARRDNRSAASAPRRVQWQPRPGVLGCETSSATSGSRRVQRRLCPSATCSRMVRMEERHSNRPADGARHSGNSRRIVVGHRLQSADETPATPSAEGPQNHL